LIYYIISKDVSEFAATFSTSYSVNNHVINDIFE